MVKRRGVVEKNEQEKEQENKIKLFLWQNGLRGEAARHGGEERAGE